MKKYTGRGSNSGDGKGYDGEDENRQWSKVMSLFRAEYGERTYQRWLSPSRVIDISQATAKIGVQDKNSCKNIKDTYSKRILKLWQTENPDIENLEFVPLSSAEADLLYSGDYKTDTISVATKAEQPHPALTFANFIVGNSNELAYKVSGLVAAGNTDYNPLYIHGGFGVGKTHLLHGIAHATELRYLLLTADKFVKAYVKAAREKDNSTFDGLFDNIELLLIDDIHIIAGKKNSQVELSKIIGRLRDAGCRIVVSSHENPMRTDNLEPGLASRLNGGLHAEILPMERDLAMRFVEAKMSSWGIAIPDDVLQYISDHLPPNIRALEGCLKVLKAKAQLLKSPISRAMIEPIMKDFVARRSIGNPTIKSIQEAVCKEYEITMNEMKSPRRHKRIVVPRQVAMYICKQLTTRSLPEIASKFGGRDHTTVIHACKKIADEITKDPQTHETVQLLMARLKR